MTVELHKWEVIDEATSTRAKRMPVPGGWIYSLPNLSTVFVPDPAPLIDIALQQTGLLRQIALDLNGLNSLLQNRLGVL